MRATRPWLVFIAALAVGIAVMTGVTVKLVGLERERGMAELQGAHSEQVRSALWRLDSRATPLLMQEIAALGLLGDAFDESALPRVAGPIRARFVLPVPGTVRVVGETRDDDVDPKRLAALLTDPARWGSLPEPIDSGEEVLQLDNPVNLEAQQAYGDVGQPVQTKGSYTQAEQRAKGAWELQKRIESVRDNLEGYGNSVGNSFGVGSSAVGVDGRYRGGPARATGAVRPVWISDELFLLRRVRDDDGEAIHGAWIDWPLLRATLLDDATVVLPDAQLQSVSPADALQNPEGLLATLPVRLVPGQPDAVVDAASTLAPSLLLGWAGMVAAALAVFAVLRWSLALSERRATFVSAVTHELRTPLTTFRMYAEMLEEGMVDETKRKHYLQTLRREADRLGELVENVLAYARIESDRAPLNPELLTVASLLDRVQDRLVERAAGSDLDLSVHLDEALQAATVRVDPTAAEQILFNLVDNAAKYAPSDDAPRIEVTVREEGSQLALCVRDYGPGIAADERGVIFEPFAKAKADHSGTKPGVGLGLALSRRLARQLGGDLRVEDADPGARFVLLLRREA